MTMYRLGTASDIFQGGNTTLAIGNSIGALSFGMTVPSGVSWGQVITATLNDIAHPSQRDRRADHQIQLKCVQAGTVGATEPEWPVVGQEIADGNARWLVERCIGAMNQTPGFFNIAQELLGYPLDVIYTVDGPGRRSEFIIDHARRALTKCDPAIIFMCDMFANDLSQLGGVLADYRNAWAYVEDFLDEQTQAGRFVIVEGIAPGVFFNTTNIRAGAAFFHTSLSEWCAARPQSRMFWQGNTEEALSLVHGEAWNPDDVTTYSTTNSFDKITDGVHPQNVLHWRSAKSLANAIDKLHLGAYQFNEPGHQQRWDNPRNLGTGGTRGTGVTGTAPTGWITGVDGVAVGVSSLEAREDGVRGYWWSIAASSSNAGKFYAYRVISLAGLGFAVGDKIEFVSELVGADMSPTCIGQKVEIAFYSATEYPSFASMQFTGGQHFGQSMGSDNLVQVMKPIPFALKVPAGSTDIAITISIEGTSSWSGTLKLGRININNRSM